LYCPAKDASSKAEREKSKEVESKDTAGLRQETKSTYSIALQRSMNAKGIGYALAQNNTDILHSLPERGYSENNTSVFGLHGDYNPVSSHNV
jgi:hypothetical protein